MTAACGVVSAISLAIQETASKSKRLVEETLHSIVRDIKKRGRERLTMLQIDNVDFIISGLSRLQLTTKDVDFTVNNGNCLRRSLQYR